MESIFLNLKSAIKCQKVPQNDRKMSENDKEFRKQLEQKRIMMTGYKEEGYILSLSIDLAYSNSKPYFSGLNLSNEQY